MYLVLEMALLEIEAATEVDVSEDVGEEDFIATVVVVVDDAEEAHEPATGVVDETGTTGDVEIDVATLAKDLVDFLREAAALGFRVLGVLQEGGLRTGPLVAQRRHQGDAEAPTAGKDPVVAVACAETVVHILDVLQRLVLVLDNTLEDILGKCLVVEVDIVDGDAEAELPRACGPTLDGALRVDGRMGELAVVEDVVDVGSCDVGADVVGDVGALVLLGILAQAADLAQVEVGAGATPHQVDADHRGVEGELELGAAIKL